MRIRRILPLPELNPADKQHEKRGIRAPDKEKDFQDLSEAEFAAMDLAGGRITLDISNLCNLRCDYCAVPKDNSWSADWKKISWIFKLARFSGVRTAVITGGEPGLVKGIENVVSDLAAWGFKVSLLTNGTWAADAARAERLARSGVSEMHISVKEFSRETYTALTGRDLFGPTLEGFRNLLNLRHAGVIPHLHMNSVLTSHTFPAERMISFFDQFQAFPDFFLLTLVEPIDARKPDVAPQLDALLSGLDALLPYFERRGIPYRLEGVPLCLLGDRAASSLDQLHCADDRWKIFVSGDPEKEVAYMYKGWGRFLQFTHAEKCRSCEMAARCPGIHKSLLPFWRAVRPDLLKEETNR